MLIQSADPTDPVVLELFSDHDDFMLDHLRHDPHFAQEGWQYVRYNSGENIQAVWVAWSGGQPAGCVAYREKSPGAGEVKRLFIRPPYRGRGLSKRLFQGLLDYARAQGCRALFLDTRTTLEPAFSLYRAMGFHTVMQKGVYVQMELRI